MSQNAIPRIDIKSVQQLLAPSDEPEPGWSIDGLIRDGDQVLLAGAPTSL